MSDSLQPHESHHTRPPCPSPTPGVHADSHPSSQWCHPAISSLVVPFSSCPQSLPASESFPMSQLFAWSGQSTGASALASFLPKKSLGWSPSECVTWEIISKSLQSSNPNCLFSPISWCSCLLTPPKSSHADHSGETLCLFLNTYNTLKCSCFGTSLKVQWLGLSTPSVGALGLIPGQRTRSHMLQLRVHMQQLKILHAATKTHRNQINKFFFKKFSSVAQSCPTLCNPVNLCTPGLPVHHQLPESTETHVHWVGDVIRPSHPLSSLSPALNLSQHQGLFQWVSSSHQVAKGLEFQLQHQSFQWTPRTDLL